MFTHCGAFRGTVMKFRHLLSLLMLVIAQLFVCATALAAPSSANCVAEIRPAAKSDGWIFHQFYLGCLAHASYLIGDPESKTAFVVDPQRDVDQYIEDAKSNGLKITHVFLTHIHADFVAGHLELARRTGAQICMGPKAETSFKLKRITEGDSLKFGRLSVKTLDTPGHTPEHISILVYDEKKDAAKPYAVLTGDCLFIGDVGRPDLMTYKGLEASTMAASLYDSLHDKLLKLPAETLVYPAHGAGSFCGRNLGKETVSTIGEQRKTNYALQPMSKDEFVKMIVANQPTAPKYFVYDKQVNVENHPMLDDIVSKSLKPMSADDAIRKRNGGADIIDVREPDDFSKQYVLDTINMPLKTRYAMWAGAFLDPRKPVIIIADPGKEKEAVMRLGRVGLDNVAGYVDGGIAAFAVKKDLLRSASRTTAIDLSDKLKSTNPPIVVDVRNKSETQVNSIEGSKLIPLVDLLNDTDKLPKDKDVVILCASGHRSSIAASLLRQRGVERVTDLTGGMEAWLAAKQPVK